MKNSFVADGEARLLSSEGYKSRLCDLLRAIEAKYAEEMAQAGPIRRFVIRHRIESEFRREKLKIEPSKYALYGQRVPYSLTRQKRAADGVPR